VLVVAGDFDPAAARAAISKYFGEIPARAQPARPDLTEPVQQAEKRDSYVDRLAPRPALALAWHVPPRNTPEHYAFSLLDTILLQGEDSRLWQKLVQQRGYSSAVAGGTNLLGNEFTYDGPMLWMLYLVHDPEASPEAIIADVDAEIARLQAEPPSAEELERALTKLRASLYDLAGSSTRFGLVELLACFALFDDDPARINRLEADFRAVRPEQIRDVARTWLRPDRRTVQVVVPGAAAAPATAPAAAAESAP
jgi:predicted Zn-dependent peptidase